MEHLLQERHVDLDDLEGQTSFHRGPEPPVRKCRLVKADRRKERALKLLKT